MADLETTMAAAEAAAGGGGTPENELANEGSADIAAPEGSESPEGETTAESLKTDTTLPAGEEEQPIAGNKKASDSVPYTRFKEVNDLYRVEERRNTELALKLQDIQTTLQKLQKPKETVPQLDQNQQSVKEYYLDPVLGPLTRQLKAIQDELTASKETAKLEKALTELAPDFPIVKDNPFAREVLENRYLSGVNLKETAQQLQTYFTQRDKKLISDYIKGKTTAAKVNRGATPPGSAPAFKPKALPKSATLDERMALAEPGIKQAIKSMKE